jgi:hypothetical protein
MGFTTGTGLPLMCAIIFATAELKPEWALGFNSSAEWISEETEIEKIWGKVKYFHWALLVHTMVKTFHAIIVPLAVVALQVHF